ncbi:MAG: hypothetical protein ACHQ53_18705, partial [Polyangiales bacterium]
ETALRIGHALDALASQQAALGARLDAAELQLDHALLELEPQVVALLAASEQLEAPPSAHVGREHPGLPSVARAWAKAQRAVLACEARREALERERDDVGFQIAQLKGRLGASDAVSGVEHSEAVDRDGAIDAELRAGIYALRLDADHVMSHLAQVAGAGAHG